MAGRGTAKSRQQTEKPAAGAASRKQRAEPPRAAKIASRTSFAKRAKKARATRSLQPPTSNIQHPIRPPTSDLQPPTSDRKPQADPDPGFVAVGRIGAAFGLKGELKVQGLTDNVARFRPGARLWAGQQRVTVAASREAGGHLFLTLKGFRDRASTEKFRHALLQVPESDLPPLPDGEYYRFQLIGLTVVNRDGHVLGTLDEVIETGANDVYRVHPSSGADLLLPALADVIVSVDLAARRMVVDLPAWV